MIGGLSSIVGAEAIPECLSEPTSLTAGGREGDGVSRGEGGTVPRADHFLGQSARRGWELADVKKYLNAL